MNGQVTTDPVTHAMSKIQTILEEVLTSKYIKSVSFNPFGERGGLDGDLGTIIFYLFGQHRFL